MKTDKIIQINKSEMEISNVQEEIISLLRLKKEIAFGDIVKDMSYPYNTILNNVMELITKGIINKTKSSNGYLTLSNKYL